MPMAKIDLRIFIIILIFISLAVLVSSIVKVLYSKKGKRLDKFLYGAIYNLLVLFVIANEKISDPNLILFAAYPNVILITTMYFDWPSAIFGIIILYTYSIIKCGCALTIIPWVITLVLTEIFKRYYRAKVKEDSFWKLTAFVYIVNVISIGLLLIFSYKYISNITMYLSALLVSPVVTIGTIMFIHNKTSREMLSIKMREQYEILMLSLNSTQEIQVSIINDKYQNIVNNNAYIETMKRVYNLDIKPGTSYLRNISNPKLADKQKEYLDRALRGEQFELVYNSSANHILKTYYSSIKVDNEPIVAIFTQDITEEKNRELEIYHLTYIDPLTNVYNRHYFTEEYHRYEKIDNLTLIYIDVNMLKVINDAFGHHAGDDLLLFVANSAKKVFNENANIIRMGGDEFIVVVENRPTALIEQDLRRFTQNIKDANKLHFDISISVGMSVKNSNQTFESVLKEAEEKMYKNKLFTFEQRRIAFLENIVAYLAKKGDINIDLINMQQDYALKILHAFNFNYEDTEIINNLIKYYYIGKLRHSDSNDPNFLEVSYRIVSAVPRFKSIANFLKFVKENYDGSGHPSQISGDKIPVMSQIVNIVTYFGNQLLTDQKGVIEQLPKLANVIVSEEIVKEFIKILKEEGL